MSLTNLTTKDLPRIGKLIKKKERLLQEIAEIGQQLDLFQVAATDAPAAARRTRVAETASAVSAEAQMSLQRQYRPVAKARMIAAARARWAKATGKK